MEVLLHLQRYEQQKQIVEDMSGFKRGKVLHDNVLSSSAIAARAGYPAVPFSAMRSSTSRYLANCGQLLCWEENIKADKTHA
eukprot:4920302-Amphidinium_carterae.1